MEGSQQATARWRFCLIAGCVAVVVVVAAIVVSMKGMRLHALMADIKAGKTTTLYDPDVSLLEDLVRDTEFASAVSEVTLTSSYVISDSRFSALKQLPNLKTIRLEYVRNADAFLEHIAALASLEELSFHRAWFSATGAAQLRTFPRLEVLRLGSANDNALDQIAAVSQLKELELAYGHISDTGLDHLSRLPRLERISLWHTRVTSAGIAKLQRRLPSCKINVETE